MTERLTPMRLHRRGVLAGAGAASLLGPAAAQTTGPMESTVVIRTTGGAFEQALKRNFFEPFTRATGVRVIPIAASYTEMWAKASAMQAAGRVEWDIVAPEFTELENYAHMLEDLGDCSTLPNVAAEGMPGTCGRYGILYLTGGQCLTWDPTAFPDRKPATWADFWDVERFPGRRALSNTGYPWVNIMIALMADGVEPSKLFPLDLDRAFRKLDQIKPHIAAWWRTGSQSQQLVRSGDVKLLLMWAGPAFAAKRSGVPLEWTYNHAIASFGAWSILKGAPHPNAALAFLNFYMSNSEAHAAFGREMGYATSNRAAASLLTPEERKELISSPEQVQGLVVLDAAWLEANRASSLDRWNRWLAS